MQLSNCDHHKTSLLECLQCRADFIAKSRALEKENKTLKTILYPKTCPCGAPFHQGLCRDAIAEMNGRRDSRWKAAIGE